MSAVKDRFAPTRHAAPYVFHALALTIGDLTLCADQPATGAVVEFTYSPGEPARSHGHPDDHDDGVPDELELLAVKLADDTLFSCAGFALTAGAMSDLLPLLSDAQVEALEVAMLARVKPN